ncbi:RNA-splicing factor [Podila epicladia]|nr:RNA-splicing factor [Podila epicladia]
MSYNGIGLSTARGSGTNGYVVKNLSALRYRRQDFRRNDDYDDEPKMRKPNAELVQHEQKRSIEVKCAVLQAELEDEGLDEDEVEKQVEALRKKLTSLLEMATAAAAKKAIEAAKAEAAREALAAERAAARQEQILQRQKQQQEQEKSSKRGRRGRSPSPGTQKTLALNRFFSIRKFTFFVIPLPFTISLTSGEEERQKRTLTLQISLAFSLTITCRQEQQEQQ